MMDIGLLLSNLIPGMPVAILPPILILGQDVIAIDQSRVRAFAPTRVVEVTMVGHRSDGREIANSQKRGLPVWLGPPEVTRYWLWR
jgi:ACT domain-containing protein